MSEEKEELSTQEHERRIHDVLSVVFRRTGFEVPDNRTPLDELIYREEGEHAVGMTGAELQEAFSRLLNYFFADGPHPGCVIRRVFAVAWALKPSLIANMSQTDLAKMLGETKAAMSWRIKKIFSGYLKAAGMRAVKVPGQKSEEACRNYAAAARGNQNRRKSIQ